MSVLEIIKTLLTDPAARGLNLDSDEATRVHSEMIRKKAFLRKLYSRYYEAFERADRVAPAGLRLEIGAGGGFLSDRIRDLVTIDVRPGARVTAQANALSLPFKDASVGCVFMLNVMHHLEDVSRFFDEASRVLVPGGRAVFIEPYVSPFSRIVYEQIHHEPFFPNAHSWRLDSSSAMSTANVALPWMVFVRDREKFESEWKELEIERVEPHTALLYLLSGGVSMRNLVPGPVFEPVQFTEEILGSRICHLATMMTVELARR